MRARILVYFGAVLAAFLATTTLQANAPQMVNYQGILLDSGGNPVTEPIDVVFTIWDAPSGGNVIWSDTLSVDPDTQGRFNKLLGQEKPIGVAVFANPNRWLGIRISSEPLEMTPRIQFATVGYAFAADSAQTDGDWVMSGDNVYRLVGNVGIGTANPTEDLDVTGTTKTTNFQMTATASNNYVLTSDASGAAMWKPRVKGGGTTDYIAKWATGDSVGSSVVYQSGTNISIGTTSPNAKLDVNGSISFYFDFNSGWFSIAADAETTLAHNLNVSPDSLIIILDGKNGCGIHQANYGTNPGAGVSAKWFGCEWDRLTSSTISVKRAADDDDVSLSTCKRWDYIRVRIIKRQ